MIKMKKFSLDFFCEFLRLEGKKLRKKQGYTMFREVAAYFRGARDFIITAETITNNIFNSTKMCN